MRWVGMWLLGCGFVGSIVCSVVACDPSECGDPKDCPTGQFCVFMSGEDNLCATPCVFDTASNMLTCPDGQTCVMRGSSCEGCEDIASFCE